MKNLNELKTKRGFSLVELMVVVAIMGTLAAIAIPAYNEYRKSAKKTAYRTDMLALHKGWLAFGVELDSYCERETSPKPASINNVGMQSLLSSKLYGDNGDIVDCKTSANGCTDGLYAGTTCPTTETGVGACGAWTTANTSKSTGPGKPNFIGFGFNTPDCGLTTSELHVKSNASGSNTTIPGGNARCILDVTEYDLGVFGHLSGDQFIGFNVSQNGVVSAEVSSTIATSTGAMDAGCV